MPGAIRAFVFVDAGLLVWYRLPSYESSLLMPMNGHCEDVAPFNPGPEDVVGVLLLLGLVVFAAVMLVGCP
jgi:hypothetical protein